MGYVIANMKPDKTVGFQVELNTKLLETVFGEPEADIQKSIDYLCAEDPDSRTVAEGGRRLVKVGTFAYRVVNGTTYDAIRNEEDRREQNRLAQQRHREKKAKIIWAAKSLPPPGEKEYVDALAREATPEELDEIVSRHLPQPEAPAAPLTSSPSSP
jgi:hypothetical protein